MSQQTQELCFDFLECLLQNKVQAVRDRLHKVNTFFKQQIADTFENALTVEKRSKLYDERNLVDSITGLKVHQSFLSNSSVSVQLSQEMVDDLIEINSFQELFCMGCQFIFAKENNPGSVYSKEVVKHLEDLFVES